MKRFLSLLLSLPVVGMLTVTACADVIVTPIGKMGEAGGPVLIIFMLVVLPLALIVGVIALTIFLVKKLVKFIKKRR